MSASRPPIHAGSHLSLTDGPYPFDRAIFDACHDHDTCCMTLESTWSGVIVLKADNLQLVFFFVCFFSAGDLQDECCFKTCLISKSFNEFRLSIIFFRPCFAHLLYSALHDPSFPLSFICVFHSNSDTLFTSTGALVSHTFPSFIHVSLSLSPSYSSSSILLL